MEDQSDQWTAAPSESHLDEFRLDVDDTGSTLRVRFPKSKSRPAGSEYAYTFPGGDEGTKVFALMAAAASPGTVLHRHVIKAGRVGKRV